MWGKKTKWFCELTHQSYTVDCINSDKSLYDNLNFDLNQITHPSCGLGAINVYETNLYPTVMTHSLQCLQKSQIIIIRLNSPMSLTCPVPITQNTAGSYRLD